MGQPASNEETWACMACGQKRPVTEFFDYSGRLKTKCPECRGQRLPKERKTNMCWMCGNAEKPPAHVRSHLCSKHAQFVAREQSALSHARLDTGHWEDDGTDDIPDVATEIALAAEPADVSPAPELHEKKSHKGPQPEPDPVLKAHALIVDYKRGAMLYSTPDGVRETAFADLRMKFPVHEMIALYRKAGVEVISVGGAPWVYDVQNTIEALRAELRAERRARMAAEAEAKAHYEALYDAVADIEGGFEAAAGYLMSLEKRES